MVGFFYVIIFEKRHLCRTLYVPSPLSTNFSLPATHLSIDIIMAEHPSLDVAFLKTNSIIHMQMDDIRK